MNKVNKLDFNRRLASISKQAGIILIETIIFQIILFFTSIIIARTLDVTLFGRFYLGLSTIQFLSSVCKMGFDQGLIRFIPIFNLEDKGKIKKIIINNVATSFSIALIFALCLYLSSPVIAKRFFHSPEMINVLRLFSPYLPVFTLYILGLAILRGFKRADVRSHIDNIFIPLVYLLLLGLIFLTGGRLVAVIIVRTLTQVLGIGVIFYFLFKRFFDIFHQEAKSFCLRRYYKFSAPLLLIGLLNHLISHVDIIMIGYFLEDKMAGIFGVASRVAMLNIFGHEAVAMIFAPNIAELYATNNIGNLEKLLMTLNKWVFCLSFFLFFILIIFRVEILSLFGPSFVNGAKVLIILTFGQLIFSSTGLTGSVLIMAGKQNWQVINSFVVMILDIILNIILIPKMGIEGAALATATAIISVSGLKLIETYCVLNLFPFATKFYKGTVAVIMGAIVAFVCNRFLVVNYIVRMAAGTCCAFIVSLLTYYFLRFDEDDLMILGKIRARLKF